jgi:hypothetical protein
MRSRHQISADIRQARANAIEIARSLPAALLYCVAVAALFAYALLIANVGRWLGAQGYAGGALVAIAGLAPVLLAHRWGENRRI